DPKRSREPSVRRVVVTERLDDDAAEPESLVALVDGDDGTAGIARDAEDSFGLDVAPGPRRVGSPPEQVERDADHGFPSSRRFPLGTVRRSESSPARSARSSLRRRLERTLAALRARRDPDGGHVVPATRTVRPPALSPARPTRRPESRVVLRGALEP